MSENLSFSASADPEKIMRIERSIEDVIKKLDSAAENDPRCERINLTEPQNEALNNVRLGVTNFLEKIDCQDLITSIPEVNEIRLFNFKDEKFNNSVIGVADNAGKTLRLFLGKSESVDGERFKKILIHEVGHMLIKRVMDEDAAGTPVVKNTGYDRIERVEMRGYDSTTFSKGPFSESLPEAFAFFCMEDMGYEYFPVQRYGREFSFTVGMLDRMAIQNDSNVSEEFAMLFKSFAHRDYSWYTHFLGTFENIFRNDGQNPEDAHNNSLKFVRKVNSIAAINGMDIELEDGMVSGYGHQFSEISRLGHFFSKYETLCNAIFTRGVRIKYKSMNIYFGS